MTAPADLIAKLEAAEGGSRELDGYIALIEGWAPHFGLSGAADPRLAWWPETGGHWLPPAAWTLSLGPFKCDCVTDSLFDEPPDYTTSIDAAVALVERMLPGWTRAVDATRPEDGTRVDLFAPGDPINSSFGDHVSEPIATCIACLRALAALAAEGE